MIATTTLILAGCSRTPSGVIPPDKMTRLMADIHRGDAVVELDSRSFRNDSTRRLLKQSILAKHGVTQEDLDSSLMWYGHHLPLYVEVYDGVIALLEEDIKKARLEGSKPLPAQNRRILDGDTVDLWPGAKSVRLSNTGASDFITFSLQSDRSWEPGDSYHLTSRMTGGNSMSRNTIVVEYNDGSAEYFFDTPTGEGMHTTDIYLDPDKKATRLYGSIHYAPVAGEIVFIDSLSLIRQRHQKIDTLARKGQTQLKSIR